MDVCVSHLKQSESLDQTAHLVLQGEHHRRLPIILCSLSVLRLVDRTEGRTSGLQNKTKQNNNINKNITNMAINNLKYDNDISDNILNNSVIVRAAVELTDNIHQQLQRRSYLLLPDLNFLFCCCSNKQNITHKHASRRQMNDSHTAARGGRGGG